MSKAGTYRITLFEWLRGPLSFRVLFAHAGLFIGICPEMGGERKFFGLFDGTIGFAVYVFMILSGFVIFYLRQWPVTILKCRLAPAWNPQIDRRPACAILTAAVPVTATIIAHPWLELRGIEFAWTFRASKSRAITTPVGKLTPQPNEIQRKES